MPLTRVCRATVMLITLAFAARAESPAWPEAQRLDRIGAGAAIIFTPDLALPGNRLFYERLGFVYIETSDWLHAVATIERRNSLHPEDPITSVILETHGTNGHGLKLQESKAPRAPRSYISAGALQEKLGAAGASRAFVSACNAGRLLRPRIYRTLDRNPGDPLFLPPTLGIVDASPDFDPKTSRVAILRREESHLETLMHASSSELGPLSREIVERNGTELRFAVSTMLIQLVTRDPRLHLTSEGWVATRSRLDIHPDDAEKLFRECADWLESVARSSEAASPEMEKARVAGPSLRTGIDR
ncbi:MAG TPA: hypothetical protein VGF40_12650 [Thermoanaerobaculia bacterium]